MGYSCAKRRPKQRVLRFYTFPNSTKIRMTAIFIANGCKKLDLTEFGTRKSDCKFGTSKLLGGFFKI